jgi:GT2 family glycosyltransferase
MISIIIVNYKVEEELLACVASIFKSKPKVKFEIIVVDNDLKSNLETKLKDEFPQVKYLKSHRNIGFGAGNNLGVKQAKGEYLFFLNPDTIVERNSVDELYNFAINNSKAGMVAPLLYSPLGKVYENQGSDEYNFINAVTINSFINNIFPNNLVSRKFFHKNWDKKSIEEFDAVPGTAFMIRKNLFEKACMFDPRFFLYFEEYDLAKRVKQLGYKNYIIPKSKITHVWEASTKKVGEIDRIFAKSRYLFFKKHYGIMLASIINIVSSFGKYEFALSLILALSVFLGLFKIDKLMIFIGDQGWFYLSARDMLLNGQIPLVGIASSHPWLHQGALWTYLLAFFLWIFNFNPVAGAYLSVFLGILSIFGIYVLGSTLFSKRTGLIASLLYATSPLIIYYTRLPYHTSPIPLFVIVLMFALDKINKNKFNYLPLAILSLTILYNFEIFTAVLWGVLLAILAYKLFKNINIFPLLFNKKNMFLSLISFITPLLPMILYDVKNGFPQTLKFIVWVFYRVISLVGYSPEQAFSIKKTVVMLNYLLNNFTKLIYVQSGLISVSVFVLSMAWIIYSIFKKKDDGRSYSLLSLVFFVPFLLIVLNQTPSDAYFPIFFPVVILIVAVFLNYISSIRKIFAPMIIIVLILVFNNVSYVFKHNFSVDKNLNMLTLDKRIFISEEILNMVGNKDYNLKGKGPGSEFGSFTMNYEYLTWWLGHAPSKTNENLKIYISELTNGINIESENK